MKRQNREIVFHSLRHLFTTLVVNGIDLRTAQKLDGHKQSTTTLNYYHETQENLFREYLAIK